jgi:hypothetical protein
MHGMSIISNKDIPSMFLLVMPDMGDNKGEPGYLLAELSQLGVFPGEMRRAQRDNS